MSKSYGNTILMTDPEPVVRQKLKTMVTDPARVRRTDPGDPDKCPVGDLHKVFSTPETMAKVYEGCRSAGIGCIECKGWAADSLLKVLQPIQERRATVTEPQAIEILKEGSRRAEAARRANYGGGARSHENDFDHRESLSRTDEARAASKGPRKAARRRRPGK